MENYQSGINTHGLGYNLGEYREKYNHISTAQNMYNNFVKYLPRGSHIGKYE
jgi:hypothetical protein